MNNGDIIYGLIGKIIAIEQENIESADAENNEIRGRIVNSILSELDKMVTDDDN